MSTLKIMLVMVAVIALAGCGNTVKTEKIRSYSQLSGKKIVVQKGTYFESDLDEQHPDYDIIKVHNSYELYRAIVSGEAEYGIDEDVTAVAMVSSGLALDTAYANNPPSPIGAAFNKADTALKAQFESFISELENSGELDQIRNKWYQSSAPSSVPVPIAQITDGDPIIVAMENDYPPFTFSVGGRRSGFDTEIATLFSNKIGRPLQIKIMEFDQLIDYISQGNADLSLNCISITPERSKKVLFSRPYTYTYTVIVSAKPVE